MTDTQPEQEIQSGIDHFLRKFTVIDFLSMFVPGGVVILALNYYVGGVTEPFYRFFGRQDLMLVGYFVLISYVTGMLIQEVSKFLERLWAADLAEKHEKWQEKDCIKEKYQECFGVDLETEQGKDGKDEVGRKIYLHVADRPENGSRLELFKAFSLMARNGVVTVFIVCVLAIGFGQFRTPWGKSVVVLASLIAALLMERRGRRFYLLNCERAYRDFLRWKER